MDKSILPKNFTEPKISYDLTDVSTVLDALIEVLNTPDAPKSRHRSILITDLEKIRAFTLYALLKQ